jgi:hypothetical protein
VNRFFKIFLIVVLSVFSTLNLSANDTFFSIEKQSSSVEDLAEGVDDLFSNFTYLKNLPTDAKTFLSAKNWDNALLTKLDGDLANTTFKNAIDVNPNLIDAWERVLRTASNGAPILRKDIDVLTALGKFDNTLVNKIGTDKFDNFLSKLIDAHPKCKTCGNSGDALVGYLDEVLDNLHKVATQRAIKSDGSLINGFDDFIIEAGEQASKAKGASLTLSKMADDVAWSEMTNGGWQLKRFEGNIPDIETGHKLDALFERVNPNTGFTEIKAVEMKNWSQARSISGTTYNQFKAYITSGNEFVYYFSDGLQSSMKNNFQNVFKDATKAQELWNLNPSFFQSKGFTDVQELIGLANSNNLVNHSILNFIK